MSARGTREPGQEKVTAEGTGRHRQLVALALYAFGARGYRGTSLASIAHQAGISEPGLLHHFRSKSHLLERVLLEHEAANLERIKVVMAERSLADAAFELTQLYEAEPAWIRLWITLAAESIKPDHPAHDWFVNRFRRIRAWLGQAIADDQQRGSIIDGVDPDHLARIALAVFDGLELQFLLDPDETDLTTPMRTFLDLLEPHTTPGRAASNEDR